MKPKLLIIDPSQFGYHSDTYYYSKYLRSKFDISYFCFNENKNKISLDQIRVIYLRKKGNRILREFRFFWKLAHLIRKARFDFIHVNYFKGCSTLHLFVPNRKMMVDIRSGCILTSSFKRKLFDAIIRIEARSFLRIGVISAGLGKRLALPARHVITPLGSDIFSHASKLKNAINFLYVGTFYNRNLHQTLLGFQRFYSAYSKQIPITYTIVGDGPADELQRLKKLAKKLGLEPYIHFTGRIPHDELTPFFDTHNVGISYVPITDYYNFQPATKTYEYLLSGMPVIATKTHENQAVINEKNGVLIEDTPSGVFKGMELIYSKLYHFDSDAIRDQSLKYTWKYIARNLSLHYDKL